MNKKFHNFVFGVSVLPALLVMPALADIQQKTGSETSPQSFIVGNEMTDGGYLLVYRMKEGVASYNPETSVIDVTPSDNNKITAKALWTSIQSHNPDHTYPLINVKGNENTVVNLASDDDFWLLVSRFAPLHIGTQSSPIGTLNMTDTALQDGTLIYVTAGNSYEDSDKQDLQIYANNISLKAQNADGSAGVALTGNEGHATIVANDSLNIEGNIEAYNTVYGGHANMNLNINQNEGNTAKTTIVGDINAAKGSEVNVGLKGEGSSITGDLLVSAEGTTLPGGKIKLDFGKNGSINGTVKAQDAGEININADTIKLSSADRTVMAYDNGVVNLKGKEVDVSGAFRGIVAWGTKTGEAFTKAGLANIEADTVKIHAEDDIAVMGMEYAGVSIKGKDVKISTNTKDRWAAVHSGNNTSAASEEDLAKAAFVKIEADNIDISANAIGIAAMSQGNVELIGNTKIAADDVIVARGAAHVDINTTSDKTTQLDGNINFDYDKATSGTKIDAVVNVALNDAKSYWNGNTYASYGTGKAPDESYMKVNSVSLAMKNGATWNATKIVDNMNDDTSGSGYVALNNLNINNGTVNIADTERGIVVENAIVKDAMFNGLLKIKDMSLIGGTNTFNGSVVGVDSDSALIVASGATMNIGANKVTVDTVTLNGNLFALLRDGDDGQIAASSFDGTGKLNLTTNKEGTFRVFDVDTFGSNWSNDRISMANPVYKISFLDDGFVKATKESVEDIAKNTGLETESAVAISHIADAAAASESKQLQELSVKIQEKLAENTPEAVAVVEHATKAVNPETKSVSQSVSTSVQNTVVSLASARMSSPSVGRNGGDVEWTKGGVWAQGLFNKSKQNDAFSGYTRGIALGMDGTINKDWTIGAGYSFSHSDISGSARDTEIDSNTIFLYGQYKPSQWYVNAIANYTMSDYSERGTILDGIAVSGDYDVDSFGGALAVGYDFASGVTPELGLRYMHVNANDYANSYDVKTHMDDTDFLTGVIGAKYAFNIATTRHTTFAPQLSAAMKYDMLSDKNIATVTMPGLDAYTLEGSRLKRIGGEFGIGLGMQYRDLELSVNYNIDVRDDYTSQTGMLKFRYNF